MVMTLDSTSSDGVSLLNHEIESFSNDITSGSLVAWVRIPTLSSFNDTTIFIYYNAPNATVLILIHSMGFRL